jgi:hypothetical protein
MAFPIASRSQRVHGIDVVAGRDERPDEQTPVQLDPDHHLAGILGMPGDQRMQLCNPPTPSSTRRRPRTVPHSSSTQTS